MSKKRIEIPDDMTSKLVGTNVVYQTPTLLYPPVINEPILPKNLGGRPIKESSVGRVKYTTAISKDLIRFLRVEAAQKDMTPADLLEIIISEYQQNGQTQ